MRNATLSLLALMNAGYYEERAPGGIGCCERSLEPRLRSLQHHQGAASHRMGWLPGYEGAWMIMDVALGEHE